MRSIRVEDAAPPVTTFGYAPPRKERIIPVTKLAMYLVAIGSVAQAHAAWAVTPSDRERSAALFTSAKQHMTDGDFLTASAELSESEILNPQVGTVLNLAYCYERMGRTATAWSMWIEAAAAAAAKGQHARQEAAIARANALQRDLVHATVTVAPQAARDLVMVAIDRTPLPRTVWGLPVPLDPGTHELMAVADGYQTWSHEFVVAAGVEPNLLVPELEPTATGGAPLNSSRGSSSPPLFSVATTSTATGKAPLNSSEGSSWTVALWAAGATAIGAASVGGGFGLAYQSNRNAASRNSARAGYNAAGLAEIARAKTDGWVANTMFTVAGAALIAGAVTAVFFRPSRKAVTAWIPTAGPVLGGGAAVGLDHDW